MADYYVLKSGSESGDGLTAKTAKRMPQQLLGVVKKGDTVYLGAAWDESTSEYYSTATGAKWVLWYNAPTPETVAAAAPVVEVAVDVPPPTPIKIDNPSFGAPEPKPRKKGK